MDLKCLTLLSSYASLILSVECRSIWHRLQIVVACKLPIETPKDCLEICANRIDDDAL